MRPIARTALVVLLIPLAGCGDRRDTTVDERVETTAEEATGEVREETRELGEEARDLGEYTFEQRDDFRGAVREEIATIDDEIEELGRDTRGAAGTVGAEAMANIRAARKAVDRNLERVGDAAQDDWPDIRRGVEESLEHLREAIAEVRGSTGPMGGRAPGQS